MGLAIELYRDQKILAEYTEERWKQYDGRSGVFLVFDFDQYGWEDRYSTLKTNHIYTANTIEPYGGFSSSYSTHSIFREALAKTIGSSVEKIWEGEENDETLPFFQLIDFSDCEGQIDWKCAQKLLKDFKENKQKFKLCIQGNDKIERLIDLYECWERAFELIVKHEGVIHFC